MTTSNGRPGLSDTAWLLSEQADAAAYSRAHPAYAGRIKTVLAHLRTRARGEHGMARRFTGRFAGKEITVGMHAFL